MGHKQICNNFPNVAAKKMPLPMMRSIQQQAFSAKSPQCCLQLQESSYFEPLLLDWLQPLCCGLSCSPPKLLVHCVAASVLPTATSPHEQKIQLAGSYCYVPGGCRHVLHGLGRVIVGSIKMREGWSFQAENCPEGAGIMDRHLPRSHSAKKVNGFEVGRLELNWIHRQWRGFDVAKIKQWL